MDAIDELLEAISAEADLAQQVIDNPKESAENKAKARRRFDELEAQRREANVKRAAEQAIVDRERRAAAELQARGAINAPADAKAVALRNLKAVLKALNGMDVYTPEASPDTPLKDQLTMRIPRGVAAEVVTLRDDQVGVHDIGESAADVVLRIAAVNYEALSAARVPNAELVAVLRATIASLSFRTNKPVTATTTTMGGLHTKRDEILLVDDSDNLTISDEGAVTDVGAPLNTLIAILTNDTVEEYQAMARLLPIFAAIEFQKTNHHYVNNDAYKEAYARHFRSALLVDLEAKYNKVDVIYNAVHWLGPWNMEQGKRNVMAKSTTLIPRGIRIKMSPYPAGTALITTQRAVWDAIRVFPGTEGLLERYAGELSLMAAAAREISNARLSYHVFSSLYGLDSRLEDEDIKEAMTIASHLAAIAQGFLDTVAKGSDLAKARALKKHAEQNIALYTISQTAFAGTQGRMKKQAREQTVSQMVGAAVTRAAPRAALPAPAAPPAVAP